MSDAFQLSSYTPAAALPLEKKEWLNDEWDDV